MAGECRLVFQGIWKYVSGRFGHWIEKEKRVILSDQLSETKIYPHVYVNKSTISRFENYGKYGTGSKKSNKIHRKSPILNS